MLSKIQFLFEKVKHQKLLNIKRAISLPYGKFICKVLIAHGISTKGVKALPSVEGPLDHVSLLWAHYCLHQGNWVIPLPLLDGSWPVQEKKPWS